MGINVTPITTDAESKAARLLRVKKFVTGELVAQLSLGNHPVVIKTATIYDNPTTGKRSYRCDCEVTGGLCAGVSTLVFTSASDDGRIAEMARALGLTSDAELSMLLDNDPSILRAMQGRTATIKRVPKDASRPDGEATNNWV